MTGFLCIYTALLVRSNCNIAVEECTSAHRTRPSVPDMRRSVGDNFDFWCVFQRNVLSELIRTSEECGVCGDGKRAGGVQVMVGGEKARRIDSEYLRRGAVVECIERGVEIDGFGRWERQVTEFGGREGDDAFIRIIESGECKTRLGRDKLGPITKTFGWK